ncbi:OmpH family outer membrane protein [Candidatus Pelagibacter sp.]|uniref:OmpH family outer membrane protein n=1 Tax=Candidatus Pelagibacter sp. TaxID=2024849 RepID=UPI003F82F5CD
MKFFSLLVLIFFLFTGISHSDDSIRFININYIVNNSDAGMSLNKIIKNKTKKIETELNDLAKNLENKKNKIVSQKNIIKKEEFDKLVKEYDKELKNFNDLRNNKKTDFENFRVKSKKKILDLLNPIITSFLKNKSIKILLQKEKIIFGDDNLDITKEILKIFNEKHKKIKFE